MQRCLQYGAGSCLFLLTIALIPQLKSGADEGRKLNPAQFNPYSETIPGSDIKFDMLPIPGGTFMLGSPVSEKSRSADEGPQIEINIKPFWMGKCEVTWEEYDYFYQKDKRDDQEKMFPET